MQLPVFSLASPSLLFFWKTLLSFFFLIFKFSKVGIFEWPLSVWLQRERKSAAFANCLQLWLLLLYI